MTKLDCIKYSGSFKQGLLGQSGFGRLYFANDDVNNFVYCSTIREANITNILIQVKISGTLNNVQQS